MVPQLFSLLDLLKGVLIKARNIDLDLVRFESVGLALGAGLFLLLVWIFKMFWGRNKFSYIFSGHHIPKGDHQSSLMRLFFLVPKLLLVIAVFFTLVALANPYLPKSSSETKIESRERIDLIDVSTSKGWEFEHTGKSSGELGRDAFLKFLKMRRGQNDRTSLWLFADTPHLIEDFITDDDIYFMEAEDAPYVMLHKGHQALPENDPEDHYLDVVAPRDKISFADNGSTRLDHALEAIIEYIDKKGNKKIKHRALLIETDAAVEEDDEPYLKKLQKRNVKVYLLHIKPNVIGETQYASLDGLKHAELLKQQVIQFGGSVFDITDKKSIERAYQEINKLEKGPTLIVRHQFKVFIYQQPLAVAFLLMVLAIASGLCIEVFNETF